MVQREVDGDSLHARAFTSALPSAERVALLRRVGRAVAALHDGGGPAGPVRTSADDVRELRTYLPAVVRADPALATRLVGAIERAARAASACGDEPRVPGHGALRTDQVYLSEARVTLIDLDGFCRSQRARDIGNLLAYLRWKAIREPAHRALVAEGRRAFRAAYRRTGDMPADELVRTAEAISLLKIAGRRFRNLSVREWPLVPALVDGALELLPSGGGT
jgi:Ser/Thr protein kinase RdoA (MazF antagonist)